MSSESRDIQDVYMKPDFNNLFNINLIKVDNF